MSDIEKYSDATFESIKHTNADGQEYWLARELQAVLEYTQWRRFSEVIERAKNLARTADIPSKTILPMSAKWLQSAAAQSERLTISCCPAMPATLSSRTATRAKR